MAGILAFWFGSRMIERVPGKVAVDPAQLALAKEIVARRAAEAPIAPPPPQPGEIVPAVTPEKAPPLPTEPVAPALPVLQEPPLGDEKLLAMLRLHEGWRSKPYRCSAGKLTVGYGHNIDAGQLPSWATLPLSKENGERLLVEDLEKHRAELFAACPWVLNLDKVRQACLIDMTFNMGLGSLKTGKGLLGFKNSLALIRMGDYAHAAANMMKSAWFKQTGTRAVRICGMMADGEWAEDI
jgi:lysozyme